MTAGAALVENEAPLRSAPATDADALEAAARRWDDRATLAEMSSRPDVAEVGVLRRTAAALRRQAATGWPHCQCCLRPLGAGHAK